MFVLSRTNFLCIYRTGAVDTLWDGGGLRPLKGSEHCAADYAYTALFTGTSESKKKCIKKKKEADYRIGHMKAT